MKNTSAILVVDDDEDDHFLIKSAFQDCNLNIELHFFTSGDSLLSFITNVQTYPPKLILMDINMPGKNGIEVLRILRSPPNTIKTPIIIYSTSQSPYEIESVYESGANSFVRKPSSYSDLKTLVERIYTYWVSTNLID